jgi:hypothetical protein
MAETTNKVFSTTERIGLTAALSGTGLINDLVKIAGDETVATAGPGEIAVGYLRCKEPNLSADYTVEAFYSNELIVEFTETVQAGDWVKITDLTDGVQKFGKWVQGTDAESLKVGICWIGGNTTTAGHILV